MNNFNYDGTYPGYINGEWIIDEKDGHVWLNLPNTPFLRSFPASFSLHFCEAEKEYGVSDLDLSDTLFSVEEFKFNSILKRMAPEANIRDYYEVVTGQVLDINVPAHIPRGVTIGSIVIKDLDKDKPVAVINLRNRLSLTLLSKVKLHFGIAVRIAPYGLSTFSNINLGHGRKISFDTFYVKSGIEVYESDVTHYSSPEDYAKFINSLTNSNEWFACYCEMPYYGADQVDGPPHEISTNDLGLTNVKLAGAFKHMRGFTGIKSIKIPFCPGISLVIRVTEFIDNGVSTPYINLSTGRLINFNILTRFVEVSR